MNLMVLQKEDLNILTQKKQNKTTFSVVSGDDRDP